MTIPQNTDRETLPGFAYAAGAYFMWGFLPIYMKAVSHIPPAEVVAHRIVWSVPVAAAVLLATGRTGDLLRALRTPRMLGMAALTAVIISVNWGIYVWAISAGVALDAALGYYINPLFSILLGAVLLGERLTRLQMVAIALAAGAVVVLTIQTGRVPFAAIGLTLTWGAYAFFKKSLPIGPNQGFLLEALILSLPALAFMAWLSIRDEGHFLSGMDGDTWLLLGCGPVTAIPLIIYAYGAKLLRLSTIGMLQYIAPTMIFLVAVFLFGEEFGPAERIAFPMIWAALALYSMSLLNEGRSTRRAARG